MSKVTKLERRKRLHLASQNKLWRRYSAPKRDKIYHIVYRITNLINGMIYVGKHSTEDLDDGYMGSSDMLKADIKKYRIENFKKEIIAQLPNRFAISKKEAEIVTVDFCKRKDTYNIQSAGYPDRDVKVVNLKMKYSKNRVMINDKRYLNLAEASYALGITEQEIMERLEDKANSDYLYLKFKKINGMGVYVPELKTLDIENVEEEKHEDEYVIHTPYGKFESFVDARDYLCHKEQWQDSPTNILRDIKRWCKSKKDSNWNVVNKNTMSTGEGVDTTTEGE